MVWLTDEIRAVPKRLLGVNLFTSSFVTSRHFTSRRVTSRHVTYYYAFNLPEVSLVLKLELDSLLCQQIPTIISFWATVIPTHSAYNSLNFISLLNFHLYLNIPHIFFSSELHSNKIDMRWTTLRILLRSACVCVCVFVCLCGVRG